MSNAKETKDEFLYISFPNTPKQRQNECILLVFGVTERHNDCNFKNFTVQNIEGTDNVQCAAELY